MDINLKPCPRCGGKPVPRQVGDYHQYFVYFCSKCNYTPVKNDEARITKWGARRIWNRRADDEQIDNR